MTEEAVGKHRIQIQLRAAFIIFTVTIYAYVTVMLQVHIKAFKWDFGTWLFKF